MDEDKDKVKVPMSNSQFHDMRAEVELKAQVEQLEKENEELRQADKTHLSARQGLEQRYDEAVLAIERLEKGFA